MTYKKKLYYFKTISVFLKNNFSQKQMATWMQKIYLKSTDSFVHHLTLVETLKDSSYMLPSKLKEIQQAYSQGPFSE